MAQELPVPGRARVPRLPEEGGSSRAEDSSEGHEEEVLGGHGEKSPPQAAQPGNSVLGIYLSVCQGPILYFYFIFKMRSCCYPRLSSFLVQAGLKSAAILLPQTPED